MYLHRGFSEFPIILTFNISGQKIYLSAVELFILSKLRANHPLCDPQVQGQQESVSMDFCPQEQSLEPWGLNSFVWMSYFSIYLPPSLWNEHPQHPSSAFWKLTKHLSERSISHAPNVDILGQVVVDSLFFFKFVAVFLSIPLMGDKID